MSPDRCGAGYFSPEGADWCVGCVAGKTDADLDPATVCTDCQPGTAAAAADLAVGSCPACPGGR